MPSTSVLAVIMRAVSQRVAQARATDGHPLLVVAQQRVGLRRAFRALTFMAAWDHARRALRRESLTLSEYAEWWRESEATAYRHQALFREAFPGEKTPDHLLDLAAVQWDERTGVAGLGAVRLS
jgi:hypothetical protein